MLLSERFCVKRISFCLFHYAADDKNSCEEADATTSVETEAESYNTILPSTRKHKKKVFEDFEGIVTHYMPIFSIAVTVFV